MPARKNCQLLERLVELFKDTRLTLFAGAGVGVRAGLPGWKEYVSHLVDVASKYERETAKLMKIRVGQGLFTDAIHLYKVCPVIPYGPKYKALASPFERTNYKVDPLIPLVKLPFECIVTTNYDKSLLDACARVLGRDPDSYELDDGSLRQAALSRDHFIARIHGRAEKPESMVVDGDDYKRVLEDPLYNDFLGQDVLRKRTCLFVGYSFLDPAIEHMLSFISERFGPLYSGTHYALVPVSSVDLVTRLAKFSIEVITYANHEELWSAIESLARTPVVGEAIQEPAVHEASYERMRAYLAGCYARSSMATDAIPLRELVSQGLVLSLVEAHADGVGLKTLAAEFRQLVPMKHEDAEVAVSAASEALTDKGWVTADRGVVRLTQPVTKAFERDLDSLVKGVLDRLVVKEGTERKSKYSEAVKTILQEIFMTHGWELAAEYSGAKPVANVDVYPFIRQRLGKLLPDEWFHKLDSLTRCIQDSIRRPTDREARMLAHIARTSFGLNVILHLGSSTLKEQVLPERIYLDASVLMPAITKGHPLQPVYLSALQKLNTAVAAVGASCEILVSRDFLNEVVHHRDNAVKYVRELKLEDPEALGRHILFHGAENTNVYVGAFSTWMNEKNALFPFDVFLAEVAPYADEYSLSKYLKQFSIKTIPVPDWDSQFQTISHEFLLQLQQGYDVYEKQRWTTGHKAPILVEHEARQVAMLELELRSGRKSYFFTADKTLRGILGDIRLGAAWNVVISNRGLIHIADLLVGIDSDPGSIVRSLWAISELDAERALREYFVNRVLKKYDEAMVLALPQIIDRIVEQAKHAVRVERINFFGTEVSEKVKAKNFLDRFEEQFFEAMAEELEKRKRQSE